MNVKECPLCGLSTFKEVNFGWDEEGKFYVYKCSNCGIRLYIREEDL